MLILRGRCRYCGASIAARYPLVELATGALFFAFVLWLGTTWKRVKFCVYGAIQIALIAMDFEERILADEFTLGGILAGLGFALIVPMPQGILQLLLPGSWRPSAVSFAESAFSAGLLSAILWTVGALYQKIRGREGLGFGDVKMVGMIGAFQGLGPALLTVVAGSVLGSVCGLIYIAFSRKDAPPMSYRSVVFWAWRQSPSPSGSARVETKV